MSNIVLFILFLAVIGILLLIAGLLKLNTIKKDLNVVNEALKSKKGRKAKIKEPTGKEWKRVTPFTVKPWLSLGLGISICLVLGLIINTITTDIWWGTVGLLTAFAIVFVPGIISVEVGFKGVPKFLGNRIGQRKILRKEGEEVPIAYGPVLDEGTHWILPGLMSVKSEDTRLKVVKIDALPIFAKDNITVTIDAEVAYLIRNPQQAENVGGEEEIDKGIKELTEAALRDVVKVNDSTDLTQNYAHRVSMQTKILENVKGNEELFGSDIVRAFVGEVSLSEKITKALELVKQNELYAKARAKLKDAGIPDDEIKEATQLNLGVLTKTMAENKVDLGGTAAKMLGEILIGLIKKK